VWEQNPRDKKTRHWVLVQRPEEPDTSEESGKNAVEEGYTTIFEITAERLRRAAALIGSTADGDETHELGFRIFRARPSNLVIEVPVIAGPGLDGQQFLDIAVEQAGGSPVVEGADPLAVAWEVVLKATATRLDARVSKVMADGATVYEFVPADGAAATGRLFVSLDAFTLKAADEIGLSDDDTLILRSDRVGDDVTLTLAPRLQSKLIILERVPREVSL
jgi:adenine-specific DNA-methyltransferase